MSNGFTYLEFEESGWSLDEIDVRSLVGQDPRSLSVVMVGAGLGIASVKGAPSWANLVDLVGKELGVAAQAANPRIKSMIASLEGSNRFPSAQASRFQKAIADALLKLPKPENRAILKQFGKFLQAVHCDVIIDLNYDGVVEHALKLCKIPYYRVIGAQLDVHAPLPEGCIVLWKLHGSVEFPSTIVLSPTEYQRIYEVNGLGDELSKVGEKAHLIWTVGVGLEDDDVWRYLTSSAKDVEIVSLWVTAKAMSKERGERKLKSWWSNLGQGVTKRNVLNIGIDCQGRGALGRGLSDLTCKLRSQQKAHTKGKEWRFEKRAIELDDRWLNALELGNRSARNAVVEEFRRDYSDLFHYMLTKCKGGQGSRWMPFLFADKLPSANYIAGHLAEIVKNCGNMHRAFVAGGDLGTGMLVREASQAVVRCVFDWLDQFNIEHTISFNDSESLTTIRRNTAVWVGANPFDDEVMASPDMFNHRHIFKVESDRLFIPENAGGPTLAKGFQAVDLHSEDEWECMMIELYRSRSPMLEIKGHGKIDISWCPPLFPWGFGRNGLGKFRARGGSVSKKWQLVSNRFSSSRQICKGGSLRDRGERPFLIARRGSIRIGEYDEFVEPCLKFQKAVSRFASSNG